MTDFVLGLNVHKEPRLNLELVGTTDVFRFAVNMLDDQVEFCKAGCVILVELREMVGADRFDPWAKQMLGDPTYDKLSPYFLRDTHCCVCEQELHPAATRRKLPQAQVICLDCDAS